MNDITAEKIKNAFNTYVKKFVDGEVFNKGCVVGVLKKCAGSDERYRKVLMELCGKNSSKQLTPAEWYALFKFTAPYKPEGGKWQSKHTDEELSRWCDMLINTTNTNEESLVEYTMRLAIGDGR